MILDTSPPRPQLRPFAPAMIGPLALGLILLATVVLLFAALRSVGPWSLDVGPARDELFVLGFHGTERDGTATFRWSKPQSQLTLYGAMGRRLSMRLYGSGGGEVGADLLRVSTAGQEVGSFAVSGGWRVYRLLLPPAAHDGVIPLDFASQAHRSSPDDARELGAAAVDWVRVAPLNGSSLGWWPPLARALSIAWMLGLLALALAAAHRSLVAEVMPMPSWVLLLALGASALLVGWAWGDPYTFALAIPAPPAWVLLLGSVALLVCWQVADRRPQTADRGPAGSGWSLLRGGGIIALALLLHLLVFLPLPVGVIGSAALLLLGLPGALLALVWFDAEDDWLAKVFLALCGALTLQQLLVFGLQALPGPLRSWQLLLANDLLLALLIWRWAQTRRRWATGDGQWERGNVPHTSSLLPLILLLLLAAALRFPYLGSAEFQADEIRPIYLAAGVLHGQDGILLLHRKGPTEVLLPAGPLVLLEQTSELVARLPFALAGMGIVLGVYLLGRGIGGRRPQTADRRPQTEDEEPRTENRGTRTEDRGARAEERGTRTEDRGARTEHQESRTAGRDLRIMAGATVYGQRSTVSPNSGLPATAVGLAAAALVAVDGFLLAFSRIVQYQSLVVLMGLAALWCAWRFYWGASAGRFLVGAAVFAAMSMLAHYDGIFVLPALALLALGGCWRRSWTARQWVAALWPSVVVGLVLLLSFYGPFFFSERFERTTAYLGRRLSEQPAFAAATGGPPFNNLPGYGNIFTFYNTTPQAIWYALVLALGCTFWLVQYIRRRSDLQPQSGQREYRLTLGALRLNPYPLAAYGLATLFLLGCVALALVPERLLLPGGGSLAVVPFALALGALIVAPSTPLALRLLLVWFAPPFLAESFVIAKPDTHFYTIHAPAALLIALGLVGALRWLWARRGGWLATPLLAGHGLLLLLALPYLNLLFVRQMPEYQSLFPALRPAIYWASYGDRRPAGGTFGFPNRSGWKAVGALYSEGVLHGDFESNGMKQIVGWYTRDLFRCYDRPAYFFVDRMPKNPVKIPINYVQENYHLFGYVLVDGVRMLDIYSREPVAGPPRAFDLDEYQQTFDRLVVNDFPTSRLLTNEIVPQRHLVADWQGGLRLRGYDLDREQLAQGQEAVMSFYWQASGPIAPGYAVAVEVVDGRGQVVGAAMPYCGGDPPEEWYTLYVNDIAFKLTPSAQMPPGTYTLRVGLRHSQTGAWLPLASGGETLPFAQITVGTR